jgi:hypothetical protein
MTIHNNEHTAKVTIKKSGIDNELVCRLHVKGKHIKENDYFTEDKQDAVNTSNMMLKCENTFHLILATIQF